MANRLFKYFRDLCKTYTQISCNYNVNIALDNIVLMKFLEDSLNTHNIFITNLYVFRYFRQLSYVYLGKLKQNGKP